MLGRVELGGEHVTVIDLCTASKTKVFSAATLLSCTQCSLYHAPIVLANRTYACRHERCGWCRYTISLKLIEVVVVL